MSFYTPYVLHTVTITTPHDVSKYVPVSKAIHSPWTCKVSTHLMIGLHSHSNSCITSKGAHATHTASARHATQALKHRPTRQTSCRLARRLPRICSSPVMTGPLCQYPPTPLRKQDRTPSIQLPTVSFKCTWPQAVDSAALSLGHYHTVSHPLPNDVPCSHAAHASHRRHRRRLTLGKATTLWCRDAYALGSRLVLSVANELGECDEWRAACRLEAV